jgi:hypothetical protein
VGEGTLPGATVQRVDVAPEVALVRARAPGVTWFVIVAAGRRGGVGACADKPWKNAGLPGGSVPDGEKARFRSRLEGGRIVAVGARGVAIEKAGARFVIEGAAHDGARVTLRASDEALPEATSDEALLAEGARLAEALGDAALAARRQELARALAKARTKLTRRVEAVRGDLARIGAADEMASRASLFVAEASRAPRGATKLAVTDWSTGEANVVEIALDPARPAREQIDAMFTRARRLKLGRAIAERRLAEASAAKEALDAIVPWVAAAEGAEALEALAREAKAAAPRDFALAQPTAAGGARGGSKTAPKPPFRAFAGADGARVLVGRGAAHNDALTLHVARPHDLWLHAKGRTGAHVIVPLAKGQSCPSEVLIDAAHLAAHFSDAREEGVVEIQHTPRRYLRKPKGSAPGFVVVDREKVIVLRVERERIARLLATEEA